MRYLLILAFLLCSLALMANPPKDTCSGGFQVVVHKGDTIVVNCDRMVLMNAETFAHYYHDSKALEELRKEVPEWAATIDSIKVAHEENKLDLEEIIQTQDEQLALERESKQELAEDVVELAGENKKLRKQNKKLKIFGGGSAGFCLLFLLILI